MQVDLDGAASEKEVTERRAAGFKAALTHAATDARFRLEMILGESYCDYAHVVLDLVEKLRDESIEVQDLARRWAANRNLISAGGRTGVADRQYDLLSEALEKLPQSIKAIDHQP